MYLIHRVFVRLHQFGDLPVPAFSSPGQERSGRGVNVAVLFAHQRKNRSRAGECARTLFGQRIVQFLLRLATKPLCPRPCPPCFPGYSLIYLAALPMAFRILLVPVSHYGGLFQARLNVSGVVTTSAISRIRIHLPEGRRAANAQNSAPFARAGFSNMPPSPGAGARAAKRGTRVRKRDCSITR